MSSLKKTALFLSLALPMAGAHARRDIPAPMTAEEKRKLQQEEEKRKADEAAAVP